MSAGDMPRFSMPGLLEFGEVYSGFRIGLIQIREGRWQHDGRMCACGGQTGRKRPPLRAGRPPTPFLRSESRFDQIPREASRHGALGCVLIHGG